MLHLLAIVGWVGPHPRAHRAARAPLKSPGSRTGGSTGAMSPGDGSSVSAAFARLSQVVLRLEEAENDAFLSGAWRGGPMQFSAAVEASALREGAYPQAGGDDGRLSSGSAPLPSLPQPRPRAPRLIQGSAPSRFGSHPPALQWPSQG